MTTTPGKLRTDHTDGRWARRLQVNLYLPLTDRTGRPGRRVGYGSSEWAFETENNHVSLEEICG